MEKSLGASSLGLKLWLAIPGLWLTHPADRNSFLMVRNYFRLQQTKMSHVSLVGFLLCSSSHNTVCSVIITTNNLQSCFFQVRTFVKQHWLFWWSLEMARPCCSLKIVDHGLVCSLLTRLSVTSVQCTDSDSAWQALALHRTNKRTPASAPAALSRPARSESEERHNSTKDHEQLRQLTQPWQLPRPGPPQLRRTGFLHRRGLYNSSDCFKS